MKQDAGIRRLIIFFMVVVFVITAIFLLMQVKPNLDELAFLRKNPYNGHPASIRVNMNAEWRKIGEKALTFLFINGLVIGAGSFVIMSLRDRAESG